MDPGSFFLLLILFLVFVVGAIVYLAARALAGRGSATAGERRPRPVRHAVSSPYHERAELTGAGRERDRTSENPEHQADDA
jgi:hypothetical protein